MNWILDNLQLVVIVASAFAWWLSQRKKERDEAAAPPPADDPATDQDELARTRRIQEEIRRKIAERHGRPARMPTPPPVPGAPDRPVVPPVLVPPSPRREAPDWSHEDEATLERQRRFAEQMRTLEEQRQALRGHTVFPPARLAERPGAAGAGPSADDRALLRALRERRSLRQAIVLREVLGPPVALRGRDPMGR